MYFSDECGLTAVVPVKELPDCSFSFMERLEIVLPDAAAILLDRPVECPDARVLVRPGLFFPVTSCFMPYTFSAKMNLSDVCTASCRHSLLRGFPECVRT